MAFFSLSRVERRRLILYVICLGVAILLWLFFSLSGKYTYQIQTHIRYQNPPQGRTFYPMQRDTVTLQIEGSGWQLLFSKLRLKIPFVSIDISELKQNNFVVLFRQSSSISKHLGVDQRLISISPDTLYFDFSDHNFKKVPIQLINKIQFKKQYNLAGAIMLSPDSVSITGPVNLLKKIATWKTDSLKLTNINKSIDTSLKIKSPVSPKLTVSPQMVHVSVPVDEFTEKTMELPVKMLNNKLYDVKLLPEKVKVTLLVGLNQYHKIDKESFDATVDFNKWIDKKYTQLPIQLKGFPKFCKLVRIEPQVVDFIIRK